MFPAPEQPGQQSLRPTPPKLRRILFSQNLDVTGLSFVPPIVCLYAFGPEFNVASRPDGVMLLARIRRRSLDLPSSAIPSLLPDHLERELDDPRGGRCRSYYARTAAGSSRFIINIRIVGIYRQRKVRAIENIEHLGSELHVEIFRNLSDGIVLEKREIKVHKPRSRNDVSTSISAKIQAIDLTRRRRRGCPRCIRTLRLERGWRSGEREAVRLDIAVGIPRIHK